LLSRAVCRVCVASGLLPPGRYADFIFYSLDQIVKQRHHTAGHDGTYFSFRKFAADFLNFQRRDHRARVLRGSKARRPMTSLRKVQTRARGSGTRVRARIDAAACVSNGARARWYVFHYDEVAEAEAQGLPYVLAPRVLSRREWMKRYAKQ
jgi:hypothetical protein